MSKKGGTFLDIQPQRYFLLDPPAGVVGAHGDKHVKD